MDRIKYRGQLLDTDEWVYGVPITNKIGTFIITEENPHVDNTYGFMEIDEFYRVKPETVGECLHLTDKNNKSVYRDDKLKDETRCIFVVIYNARWCRYLLKLDKLQGSFPPLVSVKNMEKVGTIHDIA